MWQTVLKKVDIVSRRALYSQMCSPRKIDAERAIAVIEVKPVWIRMISSPEDHQQIAQAFERVYGKKFRILLVPKTTQAQVNR
jgi:hypothetical protein